MKTLTLNLGVKSYPIYIGIGLLNKAELLTAHIKTKQVMIVSNELVAALYLDKIETLLTDFVVKKCILPDGETTKTLKTVNIVLTAMLKAQFDRGCTLIALGGGVIGDIVGFVASIYQRGVNFIQVPTTLLAQVDSSVGGKTGVNHRLGKNMIGTFYQPKCVVIDLYTLKTLDGRQFSAGMAEVIKYGLLGNIDFLDFLEANISKIMQKNNDLLAQIIYQSCKDKANIVVADEKELGKRALLNLGHSFGHALENVAGYGTYLHGEAVAIGMIMAVDFSHKLGYLTRDDVARVVQLIQKAKLPVKIKTKITTRKFLSALALDKKVKQGTINLVLLKSLGNAFITGDYPSDLLADLVKKYVY